MEARLAYTGKSSMNISVEVRSGDIKDGKMKRTTECLIVFVSVDEQGRPVAVEPWQPRSPAEVNLAQRVRAQLDAARACDP